VTAELNIHSEDPVSTKTVQRELHKSNIHGRAATAKRLKVTLRCVNDGVMTIKPGHQTTANVHVIWSDELSFVLFPTSGRVYVWRTSKETYNPECLVPTVKHGGGSVMVSAANIMVQYSVVPIITLHCRITAREYVDRLCNQVHPITQTFPNDDAVFQDDNAPIHTAATAQSWFEEHEGELQHLPRPVQSPNLIIEASWSVLENRVRNRFPPPTSIKQLEDVQEDW
jgi:hypothetical protein